MLADSNLSKESANWKLLNADEASKLLHLSKASVYALVRRGDLVAVKIRKSIRFRQEDLVAFIAKNLVNDLQ